jgi:hypothetical protein
MEEEVEATCRNNTALASARGNLEAVHVWERQQGDRLVELTGVAQGWASARLQNVLREAAVVVAEASGRGEA